MLPLIFVSEMVKQSLLFSQTGLTGKIICGKTKEKEEWDWQLLGSAGHCLAHPSLRPAQKWLLREWGRCQGTLEADFSVFMGKSEPASLPGLELRLHAKCDPKNEIPVFNPSSDWASSLLPCGNCGCYALKALPPPLSRDALIASGGLNAHLSLDSSRGPCKENSTSLKIKASGENFYAQHCVYLCVTWWPRWIRTLSVFSHRPHPQLPPVGNIS